MTRPASGPDRTDGLSIRPAQRADLLVIAGIENASFPQPWPYNAFERFLGEPGFLVAVDGPEIVGYVVADMTPNIGRKLGHIKDIAVRPDRRDSGIGSALLSRSIGILRAQGADSVKLEVRRSNDGAKRLYREFGFEPLRRMANYYNNDEDAIVMIRKLR